MTQVQNSSGQFFLTLLSTFKGYDFRLVQLQSRTTGDTIECNLTIINLEAKPNQHMKLFRMNGACDGHCIITLNGSKGFGAREFIVRLEMNQVHGDKESRILWLDALYIYLDRP